MTTIQKQACLALQGLRYGRALRAWGFARVMIRRAERHGWESLDLNPRQLVALAKQVRRYRRQICNPNLEYWAQRVLAEAALAPFFEEPLQEEPCQPK